MTLPKSQRLEEPILQELLATGGEERLQSLYQRLTPYFPQITKNDLVAVTDLGTNRWRSLVKRAGAGLVQKGELERTHGWWTLTIQGRARARTEEMAVGLPQRSSDPSRKLVSHREIQDMLVEVGQILGKHAEAEYKRYDVVWRDCENAPRLSHVFEVQVKGKIESALTKLKHAYDTQRSRPILVIADERDARRARDFLRPLMSGSFHEIGPVTTVLGLEEVLRLSISLGSIKHVIREIL